MRSAPDFKQIDEADYDRTTFLIPGNDYDRQICLAYLQAKYGELPYVSDALNLDLLSGWAEDEQIVCLRRDTWPKQPRAGFKRMKDEEGKWAEERLDPALYIEDIREMAPLNVRSTMVIEKANRFKKSSTDRGPLIARLEELMPFPYRLDLPKDPKDCVMRIVFA